MPKRKLLQRLLMSGGFLAATLPMGAGWAQDDPAERQAEAAQTVQAFAKELSSALKAEMEEAGPAEAIEVCRTIAPDIANRLSLETGWKVTRVGTQVRNPMLGTPDAWEQRILQQFAERALQGETFDSMAHGEVVEEPGGRYFRFVKAIGVQPLCLNCHGQPEDIADSVRNTLAKRYPYDQAVGYRIGDLRGAFSIKQPLD